MRQVFTQNCEVCMISFTMWSRLEVHLCGGGFCRCNESYHDLGARTNATISQQFWIIRGSPKPLGLSFPQILSRQFLVSLCPEGISAFAFFPPLLYVDTGAVRNPSCWFGRAVQPNYFILRQANKQPGLHLTYLIVYLKKIANAASGAPGGLYVREIPKWSEPCSCPGCTSL